VFGEEPEERRGEERAEACFWAMNAQSTFIFGRTNVPSTFKALFGRI
jgi:hypothetical protein